MSSTAAAPGRPRTARWPAVSRGSLAALGFTVAMVLIWVLVAQIVPPYQIPGPGAVLARMADFFAPQLGRQLLTSLAHVVISTAAAFVVGAVLAFLAHYLRITRLAVDTYLTPFLNAFPGIAWLFLAMLWFGVNSFTVVFALTMTLLPFSIINIRAGLDEMDRDFLELGRSLTRGRVISFRKLFVPMLVPYVFAALRTSFGVAWKVVLTAELFGGNAGVGYVLNTARLQFDTETIFAIILFILLFVTLAETCVFRPLQRVIARRYRGE